MKSHTLRSGLLRRLFFIAFLGASLTLSAAPLRVACIGNSVTFGHGVENREQNAYPAVLQRLLGTDYEVRNFGHSGSTLLSKGHNPYIRTHEYAEALAFRPDIAVIHLGLNDTDPRNWSHHRDDFAGDYAALIGSFREVNPQVKIYICRMSPISHRHPRFKSGTREWCRQIQQAIEQVAESRQTGLIDLQEVLCRRPELLPDALHPNAEGARLIAERVYSALTGDYGKLRMSPLYGNGMVLQQGEATRIGGTANAGRQITVTLEGFPSQKTIAGEDGKWLVNMPLLSPVQSATLTIHSQDTTAVYRNVAVGDVWMASGQSNMSWPVSRSAEAAEALPDAGIRLFRTDPAFADERGRLDSTELSRLNRLDYIRNPQGWTEAVTPEVIGGFSAVGYFFAQALRNMPDKENIPAGLIQTSLGGAPAEAFIGRGRLEDDPGLDDILYHWRTNDMIQDWVRSVMTGNLEGTENPLQRHFFEPAYLYESRIAPLAEGYTIKGVLWYQGESNAHNVELHERLFPAVAESWRSVFGNDSLPFYTVQLSSIATRPSWPRFRESQRRLAASLEGVEMAVSSDYGDSLDVHPRYKKIIGERLARLAYGGAGFRGPQPIRAVHRVDGRTIVRFDRTLATRNNTPPLTFELSGKDGIFRPVGAAIENGTDIVLATGSGETVRAVRYGWQPFTRANLYDERHLQNGLELPVSTFVLSVGE